jgi:hypothetical protein
VTVREALGTLARDPDMTVPMGFVTSWSRLLLGVASLAAAGLVAAGCGTSSPTASAPAMTTTATDGRFTTTLAVRDLRVPAGAPIRSVLTIVNRTDHVVVIGSCATNASLAVGVASPSVPFRPVSGLVLCSTRLRPGANVFPETISTDYQGCGGDGFPPCGSPPVITSLPAGSYETSIDWDQVPSAIPHPAALAITLTTSRLGTLRGIAYGCGFSSVADSVAIRQGSRLVEHLAEFGDHYRERLAPGTYTVSSPPAGALDRSWTVRVRADQTTTVPTIEDTCK